MGQDFSRGTAQDRAYTGPSLTRAQETSRFSNPNSASESHLGFIEEESVHDAGIEDAEVDDTTREAREVEDIPEAADAVSEIEQDEGPMLQRENFGYEI